MEGLSAWWLDGPSHLSLCIRKLENSVVRLMDEQIDDVLCVLQEF